MNRLDITHSQRDVLRDVCRVGWKLQQDHGAAWTLRNPKGGSNGILIQDRTVRALLDRGLIVIRHGYCYTEAVMPSEAKRLSSTASH